MFAILLALAVGVVSIAHGADKDIFGNDLDDNVCYSDTYLFSTASLGIRVEPTSREIIYTFPNSAPKIQIFCMSVTEKAGNLATTLCTAPSVIHLCKSPEGAADWTCEPMTEYQKESHFHFVRGTPYSEPHIWRLEWDPAGKGELCYPRDVFLAMLATTELPTSGNTAAFIIFLVICVLVVGLLFMFISYQLRKSVSKMWRREGAEGITLPAMDAPQPIPLAEALQRLPPPQFSPRNISPSDEAPAAWQRNRDIADMQDTFAPSELVEIPTRESLYARSFKDPLDSELRRMELAEASPTVIPSNVLRRLRPTYSRGFTAGSLKASDVLICADCGLVIQDRNTPPMCAVTGKRH